MTQTDAHIDPVRLAELHKEYGEYPRHLELSWVRGTATLGEFLDLIDHAMQAATAGGADVEGLRNLAQSRYELLRECQTEFRALGSTGMVETIEHALARAALEPATATATAQEGAAKAPTVDDLMAEEDDTISPGLQRAIDDTRSAIKAAFQPTTPRARHAGGSRSALPVFGLLDQDRRGHAVQRALAHPRARAGGRRGAGGVVAGPQGPR